MLSETELYVGGLAATIVSALGSIFNISTLYVLLGTKSIRSNPTTVLIIFLTISNLVYTGLVLPQTAASMLRFRKILKEKGFLGNFASLKGDFKEHIKLKQGLLRSLTPHPPPVNADSKKKLEKS